MSALSRLSFGARVALLLGLVALLLFPALGDAPLERAEIYFVDAARAMVERDDYVVPYYRGEPFFDKPALSYWLIAASFRGFGFTLAAARLVPALATLAAILTTVWLGTLLFDRERALLAGLVLAATSAFLSFGRLAMSDMLLALWSTLAFTAAVAVYRSGSAPPLALVLAGALGLGFLTKGPVALLLPGLGLSVLAWRNRQRVLPFGVPWLAAAGVLFLAISASWFVAVYRRLGAAPIEYFFLHENLERFAGQTYDSGRSSLYYVIVYLAEGLPWSLFLVPALLRLRAGTNRAPDPDRAARLLLASWIGLMAISLSLSRGKLDYYLLPLYPATALLIADFLRREWSSAECVFARIVHATIGASLLALPFAMGQLPKAWLPPAAVRTLISLLVVVLALVLLAAAVRFSRPQAIASLALSAVLLFVVGYAVFVPAFRKGQPNGAILADVAREIRFRPDARLVYCEDPVRFERDLLFEQRVRSIQRCDLWSAAASREPFLLLVGEGQRETLRTATRFVGEYRFIPASVPSLSELLEGVRQNTLVLLANYETQDHETSRQARKDRKRLHPETKASPDS